MLIGCHFFSHSGHYYDGACTLTAIEEHSGSQLALNEWKFRIANQQKKVHFTTNETSLDKDHIQKQVYNLCFLSSLTT